MNTDMVLGNSRSPDNIMTLDGIADHSDNYSQSGNMTFKCQHFHIWQDITQLSSQPSIYTGAMDFNTDPG